MHLCVVFFMNVNVVVQISAVLLCFVILLLKLVSELGYQNG